MALNLQNEDLGINMQIIPITPVASQQFSVQLSNQNCVINLNQKNTGLFFDMDLNGSRIVTSMICLDRVGLVRESYLGFYGQLVFIDTQGTDDPFYTGLGSRFILAYFVPA